MKVYGGSLDGRSRIIVAANSRAEVRRILTGLGYRVSAYHLAGWWGETANQRELLVASERGSAWRNDDPHKSYGRWVRLVPMEGRQ